MEEHIDVSAFKVKIVDLLNLNNLHIPEYQRPYRWTTDNVEQLLEDVNNARLAGKRDYLIGSVILHKNRINEDYCLDEIVDGQQRITTIALILKCFDKQAIIPRLTFGHSDSYKHIRENSNYIGEWIEVNLPATEYSDYKNYLLNNCQVVLISVKRLSEAFQLFETQNGRGKELEAYNLLKAYHIRAMTDASQNAKKERDDRWEDAASFINGSGNRLDLLRQVINENLYRIRKWSKEGYASTFSKKEIGEFKGLTIDHDNNPEYAYQNILVQQQIALNYLGRKRLNIRWRFENGDPENISPFVSINQLIINGLAFFDYIETYIEIYKRLFLDTDSPQVQNFKKFYSEYCTYKGSWRRGDTYVRQVYQSAIILLFDRFGEKGVNYLYEAIYTCLYRIRLEKRKIFSQTMCGNAEAGWIFSTIQNAKNLSELSVMKSRAEEYKRNLKVNFDAEKIKSFLKISNS